MKYIKRRDDDRRHTHGWDVRIQSIKARKLFSDGTYGGRDQSLQAALNWRNQRLAAEGIPLSDRTVVTRSRRNSTGIIGISIQRKGPNRYYSVGYAAEPGRSRRKQFPIPDDPQGAKRALREAVSFRRAQEAKIHGETIKANWQRAIGKVCE